MASPYTMYFAGMGTVVAALAIGFSTAVMMTSPLPEQKEQPTGFEKRAAKPEKACGTCGAPPVAERRLDAPVSPLITAIQTPMTSTTASAPPASTPQPPAINQSTTQSARAGTAPGMLQPPVRPAAPVEAAAPPAQPPSREADARRTRDRTGDHRLPRMEEERKAGRHRAEETAQADRAGATGAARSRKRWSRRGAPRAMRHPSRARRRRLGFSICCWAPATSRAITAPLRRCRFRASWHCRATRSRRRSRQRPRAAGSSDRAGSRQTASAARAASRR